MRPNSQASLRANLSHEDSGSRVFIQDGTRISASKRGMNSGEDGRLQREKNRHQPDRTTSSDEDVREDDVVLLSQTRASVDHLLNILIGQAFRHYDSGCRQAKDDN